MALRIVCVALLLVEVTSGQINCELGYCTTVKCPEVKPEDCKGRISKDGSVCRCCDVCITQMATAYRFDPRFESTDMALRILCVALLLVKITSGLIYCKPGYCKSVKCPAVNAKDCKGRISKDGSDCRCCDVCITQKGEGEDCKETLLVGHAQTVECKPGLECDRKTEVCVKSSS